MDGNVFVWGQKGRPDGNAILQFISNVLEV